MSSSLSVSLQSFIQKLEGLKDWPDKIVIMELTAITEKNISFAEHFANIIMARLTNEQTHSSYKLPMFYVIDSIMKHVGGPFSVIFEKLFAEGYKKAVFDLHEKDRNKLTFLLNTWDERSFLATDLLNRMKQTMLQAGANPAVHAVPRAAPVPQGMSHPLPRPQPLPVKQPHPAPAGHIHAAAQQQMPRTAVPQARQLSAGASTLVASVADPASAMFADLVQNEMVTMLNQMYAEMNVSNPLSLEELATINPSLHAQIRAKAEEAAGVIMARRKQAASPVQQRGGENFASGGAGQYRAAASPQMMYPAADSIGRKRPSEFSAVGGPAHVPYGRQYGGAGAVSAGHHPNYAQQDHRAAPQTQYTSRFNPGYANSSTSRPYNNTQYPAGGQGGFDTSRGPAGSTSIAQGAPRSGYPQGQGQGQQLEFAEEEDPSQYDLDESREEEDHEHEHEDIHSKYASDFFVNGFLCEVPVVIDVTRVQDLRDVLESRYSPSSESKQDGDSAVPVPVNNMSEGFLEASLIMTHRLGAYLADVQIPPRLPPILFGPLPLSPVFAPTAEALEEQAKRSKAAKEAAVEKAVKKIPMPPFRTEELGRNPEKMVSALYGDKPHQFHDDGLRFSSLTLLKQHTDKHMELKKMLQKRKEVREYREWYCTTAQWVTDFSALRLSGDAVAPSSSGAAGARGGEGGAGSPGEEYVVPADEHFTRCPVSREVFECLWDEEEGEMMYRHAVKVLVTEAADPVLYAQAQPVPWAEDTPVRYLIVHKLLVLDQWLSSGKAVPLQDACIRYKTAGAAAGQQKADRLQSAVGEDEDEEDIFVLLEFSG